MATTTKPVHTLVLDTGAIIKNEPPISTLLAQSEALITVPAILSEIRDAATRSRVETTLLPFLTVRSPTPASVKFVTDFARRTGDLVVLSKPDIQIIALTYEVECERNHGDWRLRKVPGQKRVNGAPPARVEDGAAEVGPAEVAKEPEESVGEVLIAAQATELPPDGGVFIDEDMHDEKEAEPAALSVPDAGVETTEDVVPSATAEEEDTEEVIPSTMIENEEHTLNAATEQLDIADEAPDKSHEPTAKVDSAHNSAASQSDSDSEGWITPGNLHKRQAEDAGATTKQTAEPKMMQVGVLTTDFAMQNVILQMNLNLLSPSMSRVKHLKTFILRCHACFKTSKDMTKQFCPACGQPSLTRVSCSTNANGEFKLHLKKNMQWNTRGDRYSVPKAVHGSANGRIKGGGKGGWGNDLILTEDQKEYERANQVERRHKERSLMDEDYLPSILTGDRARAGGRVKVGAGKNVNARKRQDRTTSISRTLASQIPLIVTAKMERFLDHTKGLDNNQSEQQRLEGQHEVIIHAMGGKPLYTPIDFSKPKLRILDSGGANGRWIRDLRASLLPAQHHYVCTDVVPSIFPSNPPDDTSYVVQDIRNPWPAEMQSSFDLVHERFVIPGAAPGSPEPIVGRLCGLLKPGGWIQLVEMDFPANEKNPPAFETFFEIMRWVLEVGMGGIYGTKLKGWMQDAGLKNVEDTEILIPLGETISDKSLKQKSIESPCAAIAPILAVVRAMPHPFKEEDLDTLEARMRKELNEVGAYGQCRVVWGQR
ncbi:20S-pre-rRNA D-site endonuclease nob1 [Elasticomyces elasticus]|nr:20S-pre-rRNA D-site endonuclease nob1 [Elasticomyces elasticus]KAK4967141.1 20S-pre-rRNA D-site endonuclease nob1 [Elasticomyces elasticus]